MIIYFNAPSGISGDMLVSSLIDAGVDFEYLKSNIDLLGLDVEIGIKEKTVNGIKAKSFVVDVLHHHHNNDQGHHHHRTFKDIKKLLQESKLQETVKDLSLKIFEKIAKARQLSMVWTLKRLRFMKWALMIQLWILSLFRSVWSI